MPRFVLNHEATADRRDVDDDIAGEYVELPCVVVGPVGCVPCLPVIGSEALVAGEGEAVPYGRAGTAELTDGLPDRILD